jgi:hypothetical protein
MNRQSAILRRSLRPMLTVAALALLGAPLAGRADASDQAVDACVQAFVAAHLPQGQRVVFDKQDIVSGPLDIRSRKYKIVLTATGSTSGRQIAKSTCIVDRDHQTITLNGRRVPQGTHAAIATNETTAAR